jgi:hypothetical protein
MSRTNQNERENETHGVIIKDYAEIDIDYIKFKNAPLLMGPQVMEKGYRTATRSR